MRAVPQVAGWRSTATTSSQGLQRLFPASRRELQPGRLRTPKFIAAESGEKGGVTFQSRVWPEGEAANGWAMVLLRSASGVARPDRLGQPNYGRFVEAQDLRSETAIRKRWAALLCRAVVRTTSHLPSNFVRPATFVSGHFELSAHCTLPHSHSNYEIRIAPLFPCPCSRPSGTAGSCRSLGKVGHESGLPG